MVVKRTATTVASPRTWRRSGIGVTLVGALLGGLATAVRTGLVGEGRGNGTYVVDALAVLVCVAGVVVETRALTILAGFFDLRRGVVLQLLGGVLVTLLACLFFPAVHSGALSPGPSTALAALVYLGAGRGLSGAVGLAVTAVPGYLERRIDDRLEEPW
jgi:hypothetical protein